MFHVFKLRNYLARFESLAMRLLAETVSFNVHNTESVVPSTTER